MTYDTDISIQFYATPTELRSFLRFILSEKTAYATCVQQVPFQAIELVDGNLDDAIYGDVPRRVYLTRERPITITSKMDLETTVASPLILDVGHLDQAGLHQSWLACRVFDKEALKVWRQIAKSLKQSTEEGVTATNQKNGVSQYYKTFRHTEGARRLQEEGIKMIPPQGEKGPSIRLGKLEFPTKSGQ